MASTECKKDTDPQAELHRSQLERVEVLIESVKEHRRSNVYKAKLMWWLCHFIALVSGVSGVSLGTTSSLGTQMASWVTPLLSFLTTVYPLLKYANIEDLRIKFQKMAKFCSNLGDRLEDTANKMRGILDDGFDSATEQKKWAEFVVFINASKKLMEDLELGVEPVQSELSKFHEFESRLQSDAAGFPLPASPLLTRALPSPTQSSDGKPEAKKA